MDIICTISNSSSTICSFPNDFFPDIDIITKGDILNAFFLFLIFNLIFFLGLYFILFRKRYDF